MKINDNAIPRAKKAPHIPFKPPELPPGVIPDGIKDNPSMLALDSGMPPYLALDDGSIMPFYTYCNLNNAGLGFPGYPYLAEKARISEYRAASETTATEMTRKWIKFKTNGDDDRSEQIEQIEKAFLDFKLRRCFKRAQTHDGFFGRGQIYMRIKDQDDDATKKLPLVIDPTGIKKGSLLGFQVIEPYWVTPYWYNTTDPTDPWFFKPIWWFVLGKQIHASRFMMFVSRELPDLFKPAYNFSGMSLTQLMQVDVEQWISARDSVARIIRNFRANVLMTNMASTLADDPGQGLSDRVKLFNALSDNDGMMVLDKDTEEYTQVNTALTGLDELQAQAQEHMCAPSHIPLVKLTGVTPSGLNASGEEEMQVWYDYVKAQQENDFGEHIETCSHAIQCHLFGQIYPDIIHEFVDLTELDGEALARVRKSDGENATAYITMGVISPEEERERLASEPTSGYDNLSGPAPDPEEVPGLAMPEPPKDDESDDGG